MGAIYETFCCIGGYRGIIFFDVQKRRYSDELNIVYDQNTSKQSAELYKQNSFWTKISTIDGDF